MPNLFPVVEVSSAPVDCTAAAAVLRDYFTEIADRYYGRRCTTHEIDTAMAEDSSSDLCAPHGAFLLARQDGVAVGCAGVRLLRGLPASFLRFRHGSSLAGSGPVAAGHDSARQPAPGGRR